MNDDTSGIAFSVLGAVVNLQTYKNIAYLFAPLYYRSGDLYLDGIGQVDTMGEAFLVSALGLLTGFITLPLVGLFAKFWRGFAARMLGGAEYDAKSSRQFVRVG